VGDLLGCATVSTGDQRLDLQLGASKAAGFGRLWREAACLDSGLELD